MNRMYDVLYRLHKNILFSGPTVAVDAQKAAGQVIQELKCRFASGNSQTNSIATGLVIFEIIIDD